jgi:hypothetical protein
MAVGAGALTADYLISNLPSVFANEDYSEIDCGTAVTVPTFTGAVDESWYGDTRDYNSSGVPDNPNQSMEGHLRTKFDEFTWIGIDIPTNTRVEYMFLNFNFDTTNRGVSDQNTSVTKPGALDVYSLLIIPGVNGLHEIDCIPDQTPPVCSIGTPFFKAFPGGRGTIYDWKYVFAPSKLNSAPHPQFNVKVKTEILRKYSPDEINIYARYTDSIGDVKWNPGNWGKFRFVEQALPEFELKEAVAAAALGTGLVAAKVVKSKKEWSRREFLRFPKAATESLL